MPTKKKTQIIGSEEEDEVVDVPLNNREGKEEEEEITYQDIILKVLPDLTETQADLLVDILDRIGGEREELYEMIALIKRLGFQTAYGEINGYNTIEELVFENSSMYNAKRVYEIEKELLSGKRYRKSEGVPCPVCESTDTYIVSKQTRASDEAATDFGLCLSVLCGHKWRRG